MSQRMLNVTEAKRDFLKLVRDVSAGGDSIVLLRNGKPVAQLCEVGKLDEGASSGGSRAGGYISPKGERIDATGPTAYGILADIADASKRAREKGAWHVASEVKHARRA